MNRQQLSFLLYFMVFSSANAQKSDISEKVVEDGTNPVFTMFTIANTNIGVDYRKILHFDRDRNMSMFRDQPCHALKFLLQVPDERPENSTMMLCIFRPIFKTEEVALPQQNVLGYVLGKPASFVNGRIVDKFFYGEVSIFDEKTKTTCIYVVEEISLLSKLMESNPKTLKNMMMAMNGKAKEQIPSDYNAVVTKGSSLAVFSRRQFITLSTNQITYIFPGEPMMDLDENGQEVLGSGVNKIIVENDGLVRMLTEGKSYTFRPHGRTIKIEGINVQTIQENGGAVAITAFNSSSIYDCILPTPAFQPRGGYVCKVCLAIDDVFEKYYITKRANVNESASNYLVRILDRVSWLLRSQDFNEDKKSDNVGLSYDAQYLNWSYPDKGIEYLYEAEAEIIVDGLKAMHDFSNCCLGIGYTMKWFRSSDYERGPIYVEPHPQRVCTGKTGGIPNNVVVISANNQQGNYKPKTENQLIYLTANQIVAAFGDAISKVHPETCDQFMDYHNQPSLSPCSKHYIKQTLLTCKSSCFDVDMQPFCGNGIVEDWEECDCGSEYNCKFQTCCYSRIGKHPCRKSGVGCKSSGAQSIWL